MVAVEGDRQYRGRENVENDGVDVWMSLDQGEHCDPLWLAQPLFPLGRALIGKDDLAVKASEQAIADTKALLKDRLAQQPQDPFRALIERYVSSAHRDDPGSGCILPALAADAARRDDPALRAVFVTAIQYYLDQIAALSSATPGAAGSRHPAAILSEMVGAVILSRVIADTPLAESLIAAVVTDIAGPSRENNSAEE